jgi:hypothetical protein
MRSGSPGSSMIVRVDWDGYEPYDPGVRGPLHELPRAAARAAFHRLMDSRRERRTALARLLEANGLRLDQSDGGLQALDNWFKKSVEPDPEKEPGTLMPIWYSVVNDMALYLGDTIIERAPALR